MESKALRQGVPQRVKGAGVCARETLYARRAACIFPGEENGAGKNAGLSVPHERALREAGRGNAGTIVFRANQKTKRIEKQVNERSAKPRFHSGLWSHNLIIIIN